MSNYIYTNDGLVNEDELIHWGVKGMRWGHRKPQSYVSAKKKYKQARREYRQNNTKFDDVTVKGVSRSNKAAKKYADAYANFMSEKVKYKTSKAKFKDQAEFEGYAKAFNKGGLPGSKKDRDNGGTSAALYKKVVSKKGKAYADKIMKEVQKQRITDVAVATTLTVGLAAVNLMLAAKK